MVVGREACHSHVKGDAGAVRKSGQTVDEAMATGTLTMRATTGFEVMLEAIVDEGRELWIALEDNVTAVTAIAAVRATLRHEGLTTK